MNILLLTTAERKTATARLWFYEMSEMLRGLGAVVSINTLDLPRYDIAVVHWSTAESIARVLAHSPGCRIGIFNPSFGPPEPVRRNIDFMIVGSFMWRELLLPFGRRTYQHFDFPPETERARKIHRNGPGPLVIGYCGNEVHYEKDLFPHAARAIERIASEYDMLFRVVTNKAATKPRLQSVKMDLVEWELETHEAMMETFDVAVCPSFSQLAQIAEPFTFVRNGNRVQTMLHWAIPSVASPLFESCQTFIHEEHVFYAFSEEGWYHYLKRLLQDPAERQRIGDAGRDLVQRLFNRKLAAEAYLRIFQTELAQPAYPKEPGLLTSPKA
jgi:glycosyltransferase involved in cell wall biosynthesis